MDHEYDEKNITTCKKCKEIYDKHGDTDAQIDKPHEIEPMDETNSKKRKSYTDSDSSPNYDAPGYSVKNANEFGDSSRNVRLKKEYVANTDDNGIPVMPPASQMDAFEFYDGGKRRRTKHRRHKKTKTKKSKKNRKTKKRHHKRRK